MLICQLNIFIQQMLRVKRLSENATIPTRATADSIGYDLYSAENKTINEFSHGLVKTDIAIEIPHGTYGHIMARSGLALRHAIAVGAGVIDYGYRGPVGVVLFNHGKEKFIITKGDRIAQLILELAVTPSVVEITELTTTERGDKGFGSSNK